MSDADAIVRAQTIVHETCLRMVYLGLVVGSAGNVSVRIDANRFVVSAGGVEYRNLVASDHPVFDLRDGSWVGVRAPTSETALHIGVMAGQPEVGAIVHTHSKHAAAFAVARQPLPFIMNENLGPGAEWILVTDYAVPGTGDLGAQAVATFARQPGSRACLLANHGVVAIAPDADAALTIAAQVEWIAEVSFLAKQLGSEHVLPVGTADAVCANYGLTLAREAPSLGASPLDRLVARHGLKPLPIEGGWYRQSWRSSAVLPSGGPAGTAIVALFVADAPDGQSTLHRLTADEVWHAYDGDPFCLLLLHPDGTSEERLVGRDHLMQTVVSAGTWMGGHVVEGGAWSLLGCTMSPGFTPDCFEGADRGVLLAGWPDRAADIVRLTHAERPGSLPADLDDRRPR